MDIFNLIMCFLVLFVQNSQSQSFCNSIRQPVVQICSNQEVTNKKAIYIDTSGVRTYQQAPCECIITHSRQPVVLILNLVNPSGRDSIQFKINEIEIGKFYKSKSIKLTGATKLIFSTLENYRGEGVCLAVYPEKKTSFHISCTRATRRTTTETSPSSTVYSKQTTEYTTLNITHSTVHSSTANDNGESDENVTKRDETKSPSTTATKQTTTKSSTGPTSKRSNITQHTTLIHSTSLGPTESVSFEERTITTTGERERSISSSALSTSRGSLTAEIHTTSKHSTSHASVVTGNANNVFAMSVITGSCGFVCGIIIFIVGIKCLRRKRREVVTKSTTRHSRRIKAESDCYMTENPMYDMSPSCNVDKNIENQHNHASCNPQNFGISACHYESIQDEMEGNHVPVNQHAVNYDYAVCLDAVKINEGDGYGRDTVPNKTDESFNEMATDQTIYDSTSSPKQVNGDNVYNNLTSDCLTLENTGIAKA